MRTNSSSQPVHPTTWARVGSLAAFGAATAVVAVLGSLANMSSIGSDWFADLEKPSFYPPGALFGIVWTVLYVMIAIAGWLAWRNGGGLRTLIPWTIQLVLNLGWSVFFFGSRQPGWALVVIVALLVTLVWTAYVMWSYSHTATYLFVPYVLWVTFATLLNGAIVALN